MSDEAVDDLKRIAALIAAEVASSGDAVLALTDLAEADADAYTLQHSIDVTVLGLVLGRRVLNLFGLPNYRGERIFTGVDERLTGLGVGLLLHDIGKLVVPSAVLQKKGPLDVDEWELMRQHPDAGMELLPGHAISPLARASSARTTSAGTAPANPRAGPEPGSRSSPGSPASPMSRTPSRAPARTARRLRPTSATRSSPRAWAWRSTPRS